MSVTWSPTEIPGVMVCSPFLSRDDRGDFSKLWNGLEAPTDLQVDEVFFSSSKRGVIRGMHAQCGSAQGHRLVFVTFGEVRDFVLDLRVGSPTYKGVVETHLSPHSGGVLVPPGCFHGFESLVDGSVMVYLQEGKHDPTLDTGVHWESIGIKASTETPIVSSRDDAFLPVSDFVSPFSWGDR